MPNKTVFIFGAGASHGWSFEPTSAPPVSSGFFAAARASLQMKEKHIKKSWPCFAAIKTIYGLPKSLTPFRLLKEGGYDDINLEDAATRLFRRWLKQKTEKNLSAYLNFKLLIAKVIGESLRDMGRRSCSFHYEVIKTHVKATDTLVTFNYDWILEAALRKKYRNWGKPWDYCFPAVTGDWRKTKRPRLLKPHGSLDWELRGEGIQVVSRKTKLKALTNARTNPSSIAIVPPVLLKEEETGSQPEPLRQHYEHIWNQLDAVIAKATRIVFVGYSLPRGDTRAYRTVLTAASRRPCKIEIINPDGARLREELSMIFGKNNVAWDFTTLGAYSRAKRKK